MMPIFGVKSGYLTKQTSINKLKMDESILKI